MKRFNLKNGVLGILFFSAVMSCSDDFIEIEPKGVFSSENYYSNEEEAFSGLVAVYDILRKQSGGFENMIAMMNAGSDDHFAGGGSSTDGIGIQSFSNFTINKNTIPLSFWSDYYQGIFRANVLLQRIPEADMDDNVRNQFIAEARALRGIYYFELVRMFGNIPLITIPLEPSEFLTIPQADPTAVYAQIEEDLLFSIDYLPSTIADMSADAGRLTKGAAQAMLGKVFLFQGKNALAAEQLAQVNGTPGQTNQYGNKLLDNFGDLWLVANKFNQESIFEVAHTNTGLTGWGNWGSGTDEGNSLNIMVGPRGYVQVIPSAPDLPSGWSFNVFTEDFINFMTGDPRFDATVFNVLPYEAIAQAQDPPTHAYSPGYQDTGYFLNKFLPKQADVHTGGGDVILNYRQNTYMIRLADTYLLEAEALGSTGARAQALLDAVRARVGLPSIPVSLNAIKDERRKELAGEGHRFFDLVRWGDAATKLSSRGFVAGKNEIFPIPYQELENTAIVQNPQYN
ncbi:RagB/SusD family nutrient uptake outer membrane protein [Flavobacterium azooxidireducens]|uniref:RagB/SusD family nutrient uptake outer membrane protein n=1 Tax=Flavobacterium azooxidireducens TaxID=1871076 RepID=A0ABY4KHJ8_9FLAO|nr:RagB/SusD family nutrient uptake outer membrane protein [Flavobacterium azooxidireducens]UPQ80301.1 RagB/SusD family nutrient uptake outer membrane protein [Flavobacterium azooxidireducens]